MSDRIDIEKQPDMPDRIVVTLVDSEYHTPFGMLSNPPRYAAGGDHEIGDEWIIFLSPPPKVALFDKLPRSDNPMARAATYPGDGTAVVEDMFGRSVYDLHEFEWWDDEDASNYLLGVMREG